MEVTCHHVETRSPTKRMVGVLQILVGGTGFRFHDDVGRVDTVGYEPIAHGLGFAVVAGDDNGGSGGDVLTGSYQAAGEGGAW